MDKILTVIDVAQILQVKPITVREMFREQRLRAFKVGKAWRTTEAMLREDIADLARGQSPSKLPRGTAHDPSAMPKSGPAPPNKKPPAPAPKAKPVKTPEAVVASAPNKPAAAKSSEDDTKKMLF